MEQLEKDLDQVPGPLTLVRFQGGGREGGGVVLRTKWNSWRKTSIRYWVPKY